MALFPTLKGAARPITTYHHIKHAPATSQESNKFLYAFSDANCLARVSLLPHSSFTLRARIELILHLSEFSLRHRPEACRAAGQLAHFTAASTYWF